MGGDLTVESVQNTYQSKSNTSGGGFNLGIGLGGSSTLGQEVAKIPEQVSKNIANNGKGQSKTAGVSANFSKGTAERAWVDELTEITATEELNINVKGNTHLKGAVIAALSGNLHLNTGTFTYEDIIDYDRSKNIGGSLNLSHSFGGPKGESQADKTSQTMAGVSDAFKRSSFGVDGSYEKKDKEGITRATVGAGTLNVQDKTKQAELENTSKTQKLANINRDLNATQEITKDERSYVGVYVTDTSVKRVIDTATHLANSLGEAAKQILDAVLIDDISPEQLAACKEQANCLITGKSGKTYNLEELDGETISQIENVHPKKVAPAVAVVACVADPPCLTAMIAAGAIVVKGTQDYIVKNKEVIKDYVSSHTSVITDWFASHMSGEGGGDGNANSGTADNSGTSGDPCQIYPELCEGSSNNPGQGYGSRVNTPSSRNVEIDITHIQNRHVAGGSQVSPNSTLFPSNMNSQSIQAAIRGAYRNGHQITSPKPVLDKGGVATGEYSFWIQGQHRGMTIRMRYNTATKKIETAFPRT